jgi:hypothetical protein
VSDIVPLGNTGYDSFKQFADCKAALAQRQHNSLVVGRLGCDSESLVENGDSASRIAGAEEIHHAILSQL